MFDERGTVCWMLLLRGAAGIAWLLAVEPVIKAAASAAITRPVFIDHLLLVDAQDKKRWLSGGMGSQRQNATAHRAMSASSRDGKFAAE